MMMIKTISNIFRYAALALGMCLTAQTAAHAQSIETPIGYPNWKMPTLGGAQFWTDVQITSGWRIQQNSETGHARLLAQDETRHAWGNQAHCRLELNKRLKAGEVKPNRGKFVILLHGLIRTSGSMAAMEKHLQKQGYQTVNFRYASTRAMVQEHAMALKQVIDRLGPEVTEIYFVAHSLGNLVIRRYLADATDARTGQQGDPRIRRIVMIGPPNQGSRMARMMKSSLLFNSIAGKSGQQLASGWNKLKPSLATPKAEFGIIAGGQQNINLSNIVLKGKDDYTVSLDETKLAGASDLMVKPLLHGTMMHQPVVLEATVNFLANGYFESASQRTPIPASATSEPSALSAHSYQRPNQRSHDR